MQNQPSHVPLGAFFLIMMCQLTQKLESGQCCGAESTVLLCPLVPSALFHVVPLRPPDLAKIAGIFQLSIQWLSAASAELEMGSDPKIWAGRDALGHPSMANREFGNCQLRQKKSKRHSRRVWSSGTATVLISMLLLANAQTLWAVRNTRTLCSHKKGGFSP